MTNTERVLQFVKAVEQSQDVAGFYAPDVVHEWLPNKLAPNGMKRNFAELMAASAQGRQLLAAQQYEIVSTTEQGNRVVIESNWTGTLKNGTTMRAFFAMVFELEDGCLNIGDVGVHER